LRKETHHEAGQDLREMLRALCERLARQWAIECELLRCPVGIFPKEKEEDAVRHLVREAVANAARHGKASKVSISADAGQTGLSLIIADNGSGFAAPVSGVASTKPWSLHERVQELGGSISLFSSERGLRLIISLPHEEHAWHAS
jgi:signal transduction histidine kinase